MIAGLRVENGEYGNRAVATSIWSDDLTEFVLQNSIDELELNDGKGWRGKDLNFLGRLEHLKSFKIIDLTIASVEPIHNLHNLRAVEVTTYCKTEIQFNAFPQLEQCALEWRPKAASLFSCITLRHLFINRYDGTDVAQVAGLVNVESLALLNAPIRNLEGLRSLKKLRTLRLANLRQLKSLAGVQDLFQLEELDVNTCRSIGSIREIGALSQLKRLFLNNDGDIASLTPIDNLKNLESVVFYESTNIVDGDISPLLRQRKLILVSFQNRRHYSHRREEIETSISA